MVGVTRTRAAFDGEQLIHALDDERTARGLTWTRLAVELWEQTAVLNARLGGDALCPGALYRTSLRGTMSCQYALPLLRWLGRPPEDFLVGERADVGDARLPEAGPDRQLRWDLAELHAAVDARRRNRELTWAAVGVELHCTPNRLTNLKTARLADMGLVMQITQWLGEPAARYIHATDW
ncbi:hypothetical protein GXP71_16730 [Cellulomonas sp. H30R-01]|uniref:hypothetical protein n=1 Tax=Cellulomonas sp. H30R-01 TaxID=2704467 RepID=UPI00138C5227|nr:hypothetical protein [Cellulomonas sp. H30R-01]QHT57554.1 hypothetical protein GXP71_16730 [Cellulomonas sp. H30R-01]